MDYARIAAAILLAASLGAASPTVAGAASLPNAYCEVKAVSSCTPDGACKALHELLGADLPARITVDYDNRVISEPHGEGWIRSAHIGTLARAGGQTIVHGIDGPFSWQLMILGTDGSMSYVASTADVVVSAFGRCSATP